MVMQGSWTTLKMSSNDYLEGQAQPIKLLMTVLWGQKKKKMHGAMTYSGCQLQGEYGYVWHLHLDVDDFSSC